MEVFDLISRNNNNHSNNNSGINISKKSSRSSIMSNSSKPQINKQINNSAKASFNPPKPTDASRDHVFHRLSATQIEKNLIPTQTPNKTSGSIIQKTEEEKKKEDAFFLRQSVVNLESKRLAQLLEEEDKKKEKRLNELKQKTTVIREEPIFARLTVTMLEKDINFLKMQKEDEKKQIEKKQNMRSKTPPQYVVNQLNRFKDHELNTKKKIDCMKHKIYENEMKEVHDPKINSKSKQIASKTTWDQRQEYYNLKREKKINEIKVYSEKKLNSFINSKINLLKVDENEIMETINQMLKWNEEVKQRNLRITEATKYKELEGCTFTPVLCKRSMEMTKKRSVFFNKSQDHIRELNKTSSSKFAIQKNCSEYFAPDTKRYNSKNGNLKGEKINGSLN